MKALCLLIAAGLVSSLGLALAQTPDALKERIVAHARTVGPEDYSFTRTARVEQTEGEKKETRTTVEKYDPRQPADQRWTLVSIDGRAPTADELKSHRKETPKRRVASYGRVANYFGAPATTAAGPNGRTVFRFAQLPKESVIVNNNDLSSSSTAEATVDTTGTVPFVEQVRFTLVKPARLMMVAKIERFESTTRYRIIADGKPVPIEQVSDITGSMMGKAGRIRTVLTYSDHARAR
jgi:hypothetical protein